MNVLFRPKFLGQALAERTYPTLRGAERASVRVAAKTGRGAGENEGSLTGLSVRRVAAHSEYRMTCECKGCVHISVHAFFQIGFGGIEEGLPYGVAGVPQCGAQRVLGWGVYRRDGVECRRERGGCVRWDSEARGLYHGKSTMLRDSSAFRMCTWPPERVISLARVSVVVGVSVPPRERDTNAIEYPDLAKRRL